MADKRITVARVWSRYSGGYESRSPVIVGLSEKYRTIIIYLKKSSEDSNYFEQQGLKVYYISRQQFFRIFNVFAVFRLARLLRREKVDILHCHKHQSVVYGTIAGVIGGVKIIFSHVHGLNRSASWRRRLINRLIVKRITKILTVGEAVKADILNNFPGVGNDKAVSLGNSIDFAKFAEAEADREKIRDELGVGRGGYVFGTVGRLVPTKGYEYFIRGFEEVRRKLPSAELLIIGQGRSEAQLKELCASLELEECVHFAGRRDDVEKCLRAMDVFVLSSVAEGLPRSLIEAMAAGVLCVGTQTGGVPEILKGGEHGFIAQAGSAKALACEMLKAANTSDANRNDMTGRAREFVRHNYSHENVIAKVDRLYEGEYEKLKGGQVG